jgi:hypothetical protein
MSFRICYQKNNRKILGEPNNQQIGKPGEF